MIDRPAEKVWKFVTNLSNMPKWDPGVLEARQTSAGPFGAGATFETTHANQTYSFRVIEYEVNRKYTFEFALGPLKGTRLSQTFETIDDKTRLTETIDPKIGGFYKLLGTYVARRLKRVDRANVDNVKFVLESEAPPA